jgi:hypothetical protein
LTRKPAATFPAADASQTDPFRCFLEAALTEDETITAKEDDAIAEVETDRAAGVPSIPFDVIKRGLS